MIPGELFLEESPITLNPGRDPVPLRVANTGDRPVQVGSHTHLFESNAALRFDRAAAYGCHLNIPAGTAVRFEPGEEREVEVVPFGGRRVVYGMSGFVMGALAEQREEAIRRQSESEA